MAKGKKATTVPRRPNPPKFLVFHRITGESWVFETAKDLTLFLWGGYLPDYKISLVLPVKPEEAEVTALERELNELYRKAVGQ